MPEPTQNAPTPEPPFVLDGTDSGGVLRHGSMVIGQYEGDALVLDLGWCRMAGVTVRCLDDRMAGDNHRGGVAFERKVGA